MESTTKTDFSPETIVKLVKAQFGADAQIAKIKPLTAGWFNTAYEIEFADEHPAAVLRIAPHPQQRLLTYENEMMRKELLIYETLQQANVIPIPRLLGADTSRTLIERDYMFIERYSGRPLEEIKDQLSPEALDSIRYQIGRIAAAMHAIRNDTFGYFGDGPGAGSATWREAFGAFVETLLQDGETLGVELPLPYDKIWGLFRQQAHTLDEIQKPALVHWDLWPVNIFVIEKNGKFEVEGIIDWERAYWGDPESEPSIAIRMYGEAFYQGYGRELAPSQNAATRRKLYQLYLLLVMKIEAKVRFETAEHLGWVQTELAKMLENFTQV
ncbi:MAG TPA: hypothetical protein DEH22_13565 [Chloroflexi bacterium]|nr:hypothetical protein [Chloroflexota bacterium]